jgi:hypothetical protein
MASMTVPMRALLALLLLPLVSGVRPVAAQEEEAPKALTWHHEGFAAISKAANEAKARGKRLVLGLSGDST